MKKLKEKSLFVAKKQAEAQILHLRHINRQKNRESLNIFFIKADIFS
ncbi:MAG: hypothetical protein J6V20_07465 [Bacteroidaceae bacterium]|jgi:hypothetical protein|nr:hypothetical protein [Bacteroidaceae bacterium]